MFAAFKKTKHTFPKLNVHKESEILHKKIPTQIKVAQPGPPLLGVTASSFQKSQNPKKEEIRVKDQIEESEEPPKKRKRSYPEDQI